MLSTLIKIGAVVIAGATVQATVLAFGIDAEGERPASAEARLAEAVEARAMARAREIEARAAIAAPAESAQPAEAAPRRARPEPVPAPPGMSAGTRRILAALDAFEDELKFHAGTSAALSDVAAGAGGGEAGSVLAALRPAEEGHPDLLDAIVPGFAGTIGIAGAAPGGGVARIAAADGAGGGFGGTIAEFGGASVAQRVGVDPGPSPVPLPAGLPLMLGGLAALAFWRRRR